MAAGFEYFHSGQAGAPILHGAAGRMIAVLDWALVSKGGWEKVYTGTDLAAYRSLTGNRFYLAVDDTQTTFARLRGYQTMSAVSTGTDAFPSNSGSGSLPSNWGMGKASSAGSSSAPRRYWGVRTNRYILMIAEMDGTGAAGRCAFCFGDVPSLCEADSFNTVIMGYPSPQTATFPTSYVFSSRVEPRLGMSFTTVAVSMVATPNGSLATPASNIVTPFQPAAGMLQSDAATGFTSGRLQYVYPEIWSQQNGVGGTATPCYPRARIPNVKIGAAALPLPGLADLEVITEGGKQFLLLAAIASSTHSYAFSMLEITDTDGAL